MKQLITLCMLGLFCLLATACTDTNGCYVLECDKNDAACRQPMPKIDYTPSGGGSAQKLGIVSYIVAVIRDTVQGQGSQKGAAQQIFELIIQNSSYQKVVNACAVLFVAMYGIAIALGLAHPSPLDLVIRFAKMAVVYYMLTSWPNFYNIVASFFESLTTSLTNVFTTAVVSSAGGGAGDIGAMDVFGFIDDKVLGVLFSVRFAVIIGAMVTLGGIGIMVALLLSSVLLSYLWTLVLAVQIYIMSIIARALLYAIAPVFIIFLLFQQTRALFEGWIKQLINFSLQAVLLVGFLAFFNGIFFNYLDTMFKPGYKICYQKASTNGQVVHLSKFVLQKTDGTLPDPKNPIQLTDVLDMFTLFVVIMLGTVMIKMNQWAVQAAAQLSEGGITFTQTAAANSQLAGDIVKGAGDAMRGGGNLKPGGKK